MGSLENGSSLKKGKSLLSSSSVRSGSSYLQRPRSRFSKFLLFKRLNYIQWICTVAVFFFFVVFFQMYLPGSVMDKSEESWMNMDIDFQSLMRLKETGGLYFGEDIRFEPPKVLKKFHGEARWGNLGATFNGSQQRFGYRKPKLALVVADLLADPQQLLMTTLVAALQEIGYAVQVYSLEDGPVRDVWQNIGVSVTILQTKHQEIVVDWLNYDGILVNSLEAKGAFSSLVQEPFKSLPVIWIIHDGTLAIHSRQYSSARQIELLNDWQRSFNRASVVVFPNHILPMLYSAFDTGNFYVIPGSPAEAWKANTVKPLYKDDMHLKMGFGSDDFVIAIVGSQFSYKGLWLEHAIVLQALLPLFTKYPIDTTTECHLKLIVLSGDSTSNYSIALEAIAHKLRYPKGAVNHITVDGDVDLDGILNLADTVVYGSFLEEQSFPEILIKAMSFGKPIIAPDLPNIKKYVDDRVNGYLFPKENIKALTQIALGVISNREISPLARHIASLGRETAKNMMVLETVKGYSLLLENVLKLSSEVALPKDVKEISPELKAEWRWHLFEPFLNSTYEDISLKSNRFLVNVEEQWDRNQRESSGSTNPSNDLFSYDIWEEEKNTQMIYTRKRREEEELEDRMDQLRLTWDEVYKNVKRADRTKNDLHERDEWELGRTGQPLCIYETYFGEGTWPFLHLNSLYRGIGLSTKGRRPSMDDVDAPSRLPLLNNPYYRDTLGEYGAFFAISNGTDRVHKNAWIGFQSWRATARKESLSKTAENALLNSIQTRRHGDALYFWARMDKDPRNPLRQDFWSFCDALNAGNCKIVFTATLKRMYGVKHLNSVPPMPGDGHTWSVMQSWALPTRSFLEFVMFSRMFVDAMDAQMYDDHYRYGICPLSLTKDKHCYSRLLELLVNVWAYHSGRRMVYVNPETGSTREHHNFKSRRGKMWVKWFTYATLKTMDEDLAEEFDSDHPKRRWLWPSTGEIFYQGIFDRERNDLKRQKEIKKQLNKEKLDRMRSRQRQKVIGKYVKPQPEQTVNSNSTVVVKQDNLQKLSDIVST